MEKKDKPLILKVKEMENRIVATINNAGIPAFIVRPILENILNQISKLEQQEYNVALEERKTINNEKK